MKTVELIQKALGAKAKGPPSRTTLPAIGGALQRYFRSSRGDPVSAHWLIDWAAAKGIELGDTSRRRVARALQQLGAESTIDKFGRRVYWPKGEQPTWGRSGKTVEPIQKALGEGARRKAKPPWTRSASTSTLRSYLGARSASLTSWREWARIRAAVRELRRRGHDIKTSWD